MLYATKRVPQKNLNAYRRQGKIPAILYGHGFETVPLLLDANEFVKTVRAHGERGLLDLAIDGEEAIKVLFQDSQVHPVKREFIHVDLFCIRMDEKVQTEIPLIFVGESEGVKSGSVLIKNYAAVRVECLPSDLVSHISVDLSELKKVHDSIRIADITLPKGITVLIAKEEIVATLREEVKEEEAVSVEVEKAKIEELASQPGQKKEDKKGDESKKEEK